MSTCREYDRSCAGATACLHAESTIARVPVPRHVYMPRVHCCRCTHALLKQIKQPSNKPEIHRKMQREQSTTPPSAVPHTAPVSNQLPGQELGGLVPPAVARGVTNPHANPCATADAQTMDGMPVGLLGNEENSIDVLGHLIFEALPEFLGSAGMERVRAPFKLRCPICMEHMPRNDKVKVPTGLNEGVVEVNVEIHPVALGCGHVFCATCLNQKGPCARSCSICKMSISSKSKIFL
jgi:hypothetical protein